MLYNVYTQPQSEDKFKHFKYLICYRHHRPNSGYNSGYNSGFGGGYNNGYGGGFNNGGFNNGFGGGYNNGYGGGFNNGYGGGYNNGYGGGYNNGFNGYGTGLYGNVLRNANSADGTKTSQETEN